MREEGEEEDHLTNDHLCKYSSKSPPRFEMDGTRR